MPAGERNPTSPPQPTLVTHYRQEESSGSSEDFSANIDPPSASSPPRSDIEEPAGGVITAPAVTAQSPVLTDATLPAADDDDRSAPRLPDIMAAALVDTSIPADLAGGAPADAGDQSEFRVDLNQTVMCKDCKEWPPNLVEEFSSGDLVCGTCGLVLDNHVIDTRSEWRTFANDDQGNDDPSRVGDSINPLLNGSQLETSIAFDSTKHGRDLSRLQNKVQQDKGTKGLLQAYKQIGALCDATTLGKNVADAAKHIYKLADDEKFLKGKPQEAVIAGCIFIACRQAEVPRTFREIFNLTHVTKKEIGRVFKALEAFLKKHENKNQTPFTGINNYEKKNSVGPQDLCARFCSRLNFRNSQKIENISVFLALRAASLPELAGRSPLSIAAACIYFASALAGEPRSSKEIATASGVSDGTIKTSYKYLYTAREELVPQLKAWIPDPAAAMEKLPSS